jgi:hypothetical protein
MRILCRGNVFTELLPRNGFTRYNMFIFLYYIAGKIMVLRSVKASTNVEGCVPRCMKEFYHRDKVVLWSTQPSFMVREAYHSRPFSGEVKNVWSLNSSPHTHTHTHTYIYIYISNGHRTKGGRKTEEPRSWLHISV